MTRGEAAQLLRAVLPLDDSQVDDLHTLTESWPVGLFLAALQVRHPLDSGGNGVAPRGSNRFLSEYVTSELLDPIDDSQRRFLARSSVLDRLTAPLCEAVLGVPDAADALAAAAQCGLLVRLGAGDDGYRHHRLARECLRAELDRTEPDRARAIQLHAASWLREHGEPEQSIDYAIGAGDVDSVATQLPGLWNPMYRRKQFSTLQRWFDWLDARAEIERRPVNAINAGFLALATAETDRAEHWAEARGCLVG